MGVVFVGTTKGLFVFRDGTREGPVFRGEEVGAIGAEGDRVLAGSLSMHWGPVVRRSDDGGRTWSEERESALSFPEATGAALARVWQLRPGGGDVVWAGVEPAALFKSEDGGRSFRLVQGLWDHPHRPQWEPGGGGLCLHTVVPHPSDPERIVVAISTGGVYRSDDGGETWSASNTGIKARHLPEPDTEFGQCVHKVARDGGDPDRLYLQNHFGVYRSDDDGRTWSDIAGTLPSDFGFPMVTSGQRAGTAFVIPLDSDEYRATAGGRCRVFRTDDAGRSWEALTSGLPQDASELCILRDAFSSDGVDGLAFGTRTGEVFVSGDNGDTWEELGRHLPPVLCVRMTA
jgi:hypothetical protein